jgi:hypothetical protein
MAATPVVEDGDPAADAVLAQAHREALMRHAGDDEPEAGPVVEPLAHEPQLRRVVAHEHGGEGSAEAATAGVQGEDALAQRLDQRRSWAAARSAALQQHGQGRGLRHLPASSTPCRSAQRR